MTNASGTRRASDRALFALLAGLALAAPAFAQPRAEEKANIAITGDVKAVDVVANTITIQSTLDEGVTYDVDAGTTIMSGAAKISLGDLKPGWNVAANGHELRGRKLLTYIKVVKAP
jgi:Cu/Ag efflux protein CusF